MSIGLLTMCIGPTITVREVRILKHVYIKRSGLTITVREVGILKRVYVNRSTNHVYRTYNNSKRSAYIEACVYQEVY